MPSEDLPAHLTAMGATAALLPVSVMPPSPTPTSGGPVAIMEPELALPAALKGLLDAQGR